MKIEGSFYDINQNEIRVVFKNTTLTTYDDLSIGLDDDKIKFDGEDPLVISDQNDDLFTNLIGTTCSINLFTNLNLTTYFYTTQPKSWSVLVTRNDTTIFKGYVSPMSLSQNYSKSWEQLTINCVDELQVLENVYPSMKSGSWSDTSKGNVSLKSFLETYCDINSFEYDIYNTTSSGNNIVENIKFPMSTFLGEEEDDEMTCSECIEEMCNYLNVKIRMDIDQTLTNSMICHIFSWENVKDYSTTVVVENNDLVYGNDTQISIGEMYNQITIKDKYEEISEELSFTNPLSSDDLKSDYTMYSLLCSEYVMDGTGKDEYADVLYDCYQEDGVINDWYGRTMYNSNWTLKNKYNDSSYYPKIQSQHTWRQMLEMKRRPFTAYFLELGVINGKKITDNSPTTSLTTSPYLGISVCGINGTGEQVYAGQTGSPNYYMMKEGYLYPTQWPVFYGNNRSSVETSQLFSYDDPLVKYTNNTSVNYTPEEEGTTNYLLLSGSMMLQPTLKKTGGGLSWRNYGDSEQRNGGTMNTFNSTFNVSDSVRKDIYNQIENYKTSSKKINQSESVRNVYGNCPTIRDSQSEYTIRFYQPIENDESDLYKTFWEELFNANRTKECINDNRYLYGYWCEPIAPPIDGSGSDFKMFQYIDSNNEDTISKLPIVYATLKIGDKWCCENFNIDSDNSINVSDNITYTWYQVENEDEIEYTDNGIPYVYTSGGSEIKYLCFTIGFDIKIDDYVIGSWHDIASNVTYKMNIGEAGTAIPIPYGSGVEGEIDFRIVGTTNIIWTNQYKTKASLWNHSHWKYNYYELLKYIETIWFKKLTFKFINDNSGNQTSGETGDVIWSSDVDNSYRNTKENEWKFCSYLTSEEAKYFNTKQTIATNIPQDENGNVMLFTDKNGDKYSPEQFWIDTYYNIYGSEPKVEMTMTMQDDDGDMEDQTYSFSKNYGFKNNTFFVYNRERDVKNNKIKIVMRQI